MPRSRMHVVALTLACALAPAGCRDAPTAPQSLDATLRVVQLTSDADRRAWPFTPTVQGGSALVVRGTALVGCGRPAVDAQRRGRQVSVALVALNAAGPCIQIVDGYVPFEIAVRGLPAGAYRVHATAAGQQGRADWQITVGP